MTKFCVQSFTIPFIFKELLFVLKHGMLQGAYKVAGNHAWRMYIIRLMSVVYSYTFNLKNKAV